MPAPLLLLIAVVEKDLSGTLAQTPPEWQEKIVLLQHGRGDKKSTRPQMPGQGRP